MVVVVVGEFCAALHYCNWVELDAPVYICDVCRQPFSREYTMVNHVEKSHWTPTLDPKEHYHTRLVSDVLKKVRKQDKVKDGKVRPRFGTTYLCQVCGKTGMGQDPAARHLSIDGDGQLTCRTQCTDGLRLSHMQRILLFSNKLGFLCDFCGAVFANKSSLDMHLLHNHGQTTKRSEKYKCPTCNHSFPDGSSLKSHKRTHLVQPKTHICDMCGKSFKSRDTLYGHRRRVHQLANRYQCQYCSKTYYIKALWKTHMQQHLGESPYHCSVCNQGFSSNYCLMVHTRIHTGEKPYKCDQCDAAFAQKNSLDVHMKKHQIPDHIAKRRHSSTSKPRERSASDTRHNVARTDVGLNMARTDVSQDMASSDIRLNMARTDVGLNMARTDVGLNMARTDVSQDMASSDIRLNMARTDVGLNMARTDVGQDMVRTDVRHNMARTDVSQNQTRADMGHPDYRAVPPQPLPPQQQAPPSRPMSAESSGSSRQETPHYMDSSRHAQGDGRDGRQAAPAFPGGLNMNPVFPGFPGFAGYNYTEPNYMLPLPPHFQPR